MTSCYANNMGGWSDWQKFYRFGTILVLPPQCVSEQIDKLRTRYDPISQSAIGTHISLTVPLPREPVDRHWALLQEIASSLASLTIRYGPLTPFLPKPGAALHIEPQLELDSLRRAFEACEMFRGAAPRILPFWAHMTIAELITEQESKDMIREMGEGRAPEGSFVCDALSYVVPDEGFRFSERRRLALGRTR